MDKYEKRRVRLAELRDQKYHGSASDLARAIGKEPSYVSRMLYPAGKAGKKRIGEDMVDVIETALGWPKGSIDSDLPIAEFSSVKGGKSIEKLHLIGDLLGKMSSDDTTKSFTKDDPATSVHPPPQYEIDLSKFRRIYVIGKAPGGLPAILWKDGNTPVGATDEYAELASSDPRAFICPVIGDSMFPRFMPGEYVLVQPSRPPEIEDTVLVRLESGDTMLKRLLSRRDNHVRLGAWNDPTIVTHREDEITWIYSVAHAVPAWMIKHMV
jgi:phage repressor protein C with HTH and peptisase S24 domain